MKIPGKLFLVIGLFMLAAIPLQGSSTADRLGPVYPIIEPDWLEWLPKQAEKRFKEKPFTLSKDQLKQAIQRQMPNFDLPEVQVARTYYIDPSAKVSQPIVDHTGKIVVQTGGKINPLDHLPGFRPIIILDGQKEWQVKWAEEALTKDRALVLVTGGDVMNLNKRLGIPVYPAPQALIEKFSIERVPAILSREGKQIKVEEVIP
jgi:conjugal transfer pilus assembly protein TraW